MKGVHEQKSLCTPLRGLGFQKTARIVALAWKYYEEIGNTAYITFDSFDSKDGDGMYLAPEDRILVW